MHSQFEEKKRFVTLLAYADAVMPPILHMEDTGSDLVLTNTLQEAAAIITNKLLDLIIIDMDFGLKLVAETRPTGSINHHTPIIALVDKPDTGLRTQLITAGFDDCLVKPLSASDLSGLVKFWCENKVLDSFLESTETLLAIFRKNNGVVLKLYHKLFEELPQQVGTINIALNTGQYQLAFDTSHKIIGSAKICYLKDIEASAKALEQCLSQKKYDLVEGYFLMLQHSVAAFIDHRQFILAYLDEQLSDKQ
jgi:HPt (histidine-containing phosphotransfer) domain-containing protein